MDISTLKQQIIVTQNEAGESVVQMPIEVWDQLESYLAEESPDLDPMDYTGIKALVKAWQEQPDDKSPEWWAEFDQFMRENRPTFPLRDLGFGDE
jgi:hypothetical protein